MKKPSIFDKLSFQFHEYFYYTRTERNATIVLVLLCLFFLLLPCFYGMLVPPRPQTDFSAFKAALEEAGIGRQPVADAAETADYRPDFRGASEEKRAAELFQFDPNTASKEDFVRLGLSPRTAQTVLNYRSKGGRFFKKEDLKKLYGLRDEDYQRLVDWVVIPENNKEKTDEKQPFNREAAFVQETVEEGSFSPSGEPAKYPKKEYATAPIDINKATADDWQTLRGIGPAYAKYIVNFREKLGGFSSVDQVAATRGLPDSVFQKIKPYLTPSPITKKLALNQCSLDELKAHPYLSSYQATILFNYRQQHGNYNNMEDLKKIAAGFKEEDWLRLAPYLAF